MAMRASGMVPPAASAPGSMMSVRRSNLALVMSKVAESSSDTHLTRAQLASITGLTKASISSLVLDLLNIGVIREFGLNPRGDRGRPGVGLQLNPSQAVMGLEINIDYIAAAVTDLSGTLLVHRTQERNNRSSLSDPLLQDLAVLAASVASDVRARQVRILGAGLAVPGLIDAQRGVVMSAPNLGWKDVLLDLDAIGPGLPLGVTLHNEANASALAHLRQGTGAAQDFLFISGEVGIGGGLVVGSQLFTGPGGHAGEVGHVIVDPGGADCSCGATGCLETIAGQDAIFAAAGLLPQTSHADIMAELLRELAGGVKDADYAVHRAGWYLGVALASTAKIVSVNSVVLGGHFAILAPWLRSSLLTSLARHAPGRFSPEQVEVSIFGKTAALRGAAGSVVRAVVEAPHRLSDG